MATPGTAGDKIRVSVSASDGIGIPNEDVVGHCAAAAWVIDGATGLGPSLIGGPSDAAWLANRADRALQAEFARDPARSTTEIVRAVIGSCRDDFAREQRHVPEGPHALPSAAIAIVRATRAGVEFATLGDCRIAYDAADGAAQLFGTTALAGFEARTIAAAERILMQVPDVTPLDLRALLLPQLLENRRMMNRPGGYWVLGLDPAAADHLDRTIVAAQPGDRFALATDGFLRLIELFAVATPDDFLGIDTPAALDDWLSRLRALETAPDSCRQYPRVKVSDDASFLHCTLA